MPKQKKANNNKVKDTGNQFPKLQLTRPVNLGIGFPRRLNVVHKYNDQFTLTSTSGVMANYRFRTNGMFDPNHTAAGHQGSYYDNLTAIYDHWIVISSRIDITCIPSAAVTVPLAFGLAINDDTSTANTSFVAYGESNFAKLRFAAIGNTTPHYLSMDWDSKMVFPGDPRPNNDLWGSTSADPLEEQIFNIFLQAVDQLNNVAMLCVAQITYNVEWFELKDLVVS